MAFRPRGVGAEARGQAHSGLPRAADAPARARVSFDRLGTVGGKVQVTGTSYCPPRQNREHGRPGSPATGEGTPGVATVTFGRARWKEPPSLTAHRDQNLGPVSTHVWGIRKRR